MLPTICGLPTLSTNELLPFKANVDGFSEVTGREAVENSIKLNLPNNSCGFCITISKGDNSPDLKVPIEAKVVKLPTTLSLLLVVSDRIAVIAILF